MSMDQFFTREKAGQGVKVPLYLPTGEKSDYWLVLRGIDSDEFRMAETEEKRSAAMIAHTGEAVDLNKAEMEGKVRLLSSLVADWNFDEECTNDNVVKLLTEAPQICDTIDQFVGKRALFFAMQSNASESTQKKTSRSTKSRKGQSKRSGKA